MKRRNGETPISAEASARRPVRRSFGLVNTVLKVPGMWAMGAAGLMPVILAGNAGTALAQRPDVIIAGRYVAPGGTLESGVAIVLSEGLITKVVSADDYADDKNAAGAKHVVRFPNAVVCPGLIDVRSTLGAYGKNVETAHAIDPGASAVDSLDRHHRDFRSAIRAGITTALITPAGNNLVSGAAVVVKTAEVGARSGVLRSDGPLVLALGPSVWSYDRAPTSRVGSLAMLRDALAQAADGHGHQRLVAFARGQLDGMVVCDEAIDVDAALSVLGGVEASIAIVHTSDTHELADELVKAKCPIVIGPYSFDTPPRTLAAAAAFASAGVPVAFAGSMPVGSGDALRTTAALAVRYGMDPAKARQAITAVPAAVAGVSDRVGAIAPGLDADLVVFSDDPLRLDARVLEVYVEGVRVYNSEGDFNASCSKRPGARKSRLTGGVGSSFEGGVR